MNLAPYIEHAQLKIETTTADVKKLVEEAREFGFYGICIPPWFVKEVSKMVSGSPVKVVTVAGFPMGYSATPAKVEEIKRAINDGADEVDVVINLAALKSDDWKYVANDIESTTRAIQLKGKVAKIIVEANLLQPEELKKVCKFCVDAGVNFVKTNTGFNGNVCSTEMVKTIRALLPPQIKIKASGGIRTLDFAIELVKAGAARLGGSVFADLLKK